MDGVGNQSYCTWKKPLTLRKQTDKHSHARICHELDLKLGGERL